MENPVAVMDTLDQPWVMKQAQPLLSSGLDAVKYFRWREDASIALPGVGAHYCWTSVKFSTAGGGLPGRSSLWLDGGRGRRYIQLYGGFHAV